MIDWRLTQLSADRHPWQLAVGDREVRGFDFGAPIDSVTVSLIALPDLTAVDLTLPVSISEAVASVTLDATELVRGAWYELTVTAHTVDGQRRSRVLAVEIVAGAGAV